MRESIVAVVIVASFVLYVASSAPRPFPLGAVVTIPKATSISGTGVLLAQAGVVRSATLFRLVNGPRILHAGTYVFETPQHVFRIASRIREGEQGFEPVKITFPEGETAREMAERVSTTFPHISIEAFRTEVAEYEGFLFPETYVFSPFTDSASIVRKMRDTFTKKIAPFAPEVSASGHSLSEIVIMASLIEKEARTSEARRMVSGILWNRIDLGMALQVDAVFGYIFNRDTYSPSFADLKVDSPYNTYLFKGLPPGPISNPGLDSIDAALHPTETAYLYYLTGSDEKMHYATTYAGHLENQRRYLK